MTQPEHAGQGKANAPGQQQPGSGNPAPGKSGEPGRGHSEEKRQERADERAKTEPGAEDTGDAGTVQQP